MTAELQKFIIHKRKNSIWRRQSIKIIYPAFSFINTAKDLIAGLAFFMTMDIQSLTLEGKINKNAA